MVEERVVGADSASVPSAPLQRDWLSMTARVQASSTSMYFNPCTDSFSSEPSSPVEAPTTRFHFSDEEETQRKLLEINFNTASEAVLLLRRVTEECKGRTALEEMQLSLESSCKDTSARVSNMLLYKLHGALQGGSFMSDFISEGGIPGLFDLLEACGGNHLQPEVLRVVKVLCCSTIGAAAVSTTENMLRVLQCFSADQLLSSRAQQSYALKTAHHSLGLLTFLAYNSQAEKVHRVMCCPPPPPTARHSPRKRGASFSHTEREREAGYDCLSVVLTLAGTTHLNVARSVLLFLICMVGSLGGRQAVSVVDVCTRDNLRRALCSCLEVADRQVQSLAFILLSLICDSGATEAEICYKRAFLKNIETTNNNAAYSASLACLAAKEIVYLLKNFRAGAEVASNRNVLKTEGLMELLREMVYEILNDVEGVPQRTLPCLQGVGRANIMGEEGNCFAGLLCALLSSEVSITADGLPDSYTIPPTALSNFITIGHGSFGTVYKATYSSTMETVAVKELRTKPTEAPLTRLKRKRAFLRETTYLMSLRHNSIVNFYGWVKTNGTEWMVTEFCPGGTLTSLTHNGSLGPQERGWVALQTGLCIGQALAYLHSRSPRLVHMDVAARNVLVCSNGLFKLGDVGSLCTEGTPNPVICVPWAPPEALQRDVVYKSRASYDIWSFACLLWEVLEGGTPFRSLLCEVEEGGVSFAELVRDEVVGGGKGAPPYVVEEDALAKSLWDAAIGPSWVPERARLATLEVLVRLQALSDQFPNPRSSPTSPSDSGAFEPGAYFGAGGEYFGESGGVVSEDFPSISEGGAVGGGDDCFYPYLSRSES